MHIYSHHDLYRCIFKLYEHRRRLNCKSWCQAFDARIEASDQEAQLLSLFFCLKQNLKSLVAPTNVPLWETPI